MNGRCDRVLDSRKRMGDHVCARKASVISNRTIFTAKYGEQPYTLEYCSKHAKHAYIVESPRIIRLVSVEVR